MVNVLCFRYVMLFDKIRFSTAPDDAACSSFFFLCYCKGNRRKDSERLHNCHVIVMVLRGAIKSALKPQVPNAQFATNVYCVYSLCHKGLFLSVSFIRVK